MIFNLFFRWVQELIQQQQQQQKSIQALTSEIRKLRESNLASDVPNAAHLQRRRPSLVEVIILVVSFGLKTNV